MKLSAKDITNIYCCMQSRNVVLYGAGVNGSLALKTLDAEKISVMAVADRIVEKRCGSFQTISLKKLCERSNNEVCIITPSHSISYAKEQLVKHFTMVVDIQIINWLQYFIPKDTEEIEYTSCFPFNHYESPYAQNRELEFNRLSLQNEEEINDIDLNLEYQMTFLYKLKDYYKEFLERISAEKNKMRYTPDNGWFDIADASLLHSIIMEYKPKNIVEIGSGYSTCVMLDTNEFWKKNLITITCIEPYPERLFQKIRECDMNDLKINKDYIQNIPLEAFDMLESGDILFVDSSHVGRAGGDVPWVYFNILPRLKSGVLIHIHDILYPFTYPETWLKQGRSYNEAFLVRALLMNSNRYKMIFFNDMMISKYGNEYKEAWSTGDKPFGGSLWLRVK
jgi:predicted O-methyltransferase YrrM